MNDQEKPQCKVCGAEPDEYGEMRHGKGCYVLHEDGGGARYYPEWDKASMEYKGEDPSPQG